MGLCYDAIRANVREPWHGTYPLIEIRCISCDDSLYAQECALRQAVLLDPIPMDMADFRAEFPGVEERAEHYVALIDHPAGRRVVGCALLIPVLPEPGVGKLMQMAVNHQRRGEGIGRKLIATIESEAFGRLGLPQIMCHAREDATGFYKRLGWVLDSDVFFEVGIPHRKMTFTHG